MIRRLAALTVLASAILGLGLGCSSGTSKVEVKVTLDDQPLSGATVVFSPDSGTAVPPSGLTDDKGMCRIKSGNSDSVPAGNYSVTISKTDSFGGTSGDPMKDMMKAGKDGGSLGGKGGNPAGPAMAPMPGGPKGVKSSIPGKYGDAKSSGLTCKVPEETSGVKEFKLTSK
jgi:hypothetical protein